jgi:AcrR family transcriptional regulator
MTELLPALSKSTRGAERRQRILLSAADLMAEHGYSSVSMAQIGAAAGIVGSGVYRHFDSKATILGAFLDGVVEAMRVGTREIVASESGQGLLDAMVRRQTGIVLANRSLVTVYLRDAGNLPPKQLRETRRQQRRFVEEWIEQCAIVAPSASDLELRTVVQAVLALIT